jgi:K+:H+ antiporter
VAGGLAGAGGGTLINPAVVVDNPGLLATMIGLIVVGKLVIFLLVQAARAAGLVGDDIDNATLASSLVTILINAALVRYVARPG